MTKAERQGVGRASVPASPDFKVQIRHRARGDARPPDANPALWRSGGRLRGVSATRPSTDRLATLPSSDDAGHHTTFFTTQWSVVLAARRSDTTCAQAALARLCQAYWYPLYAYVRRRGHQAYDAEDLTQEFFARLLA